MASTKTNRVKLPQKSICPFRMRGIPKVRCKTDKTTSERSSSKRKQKIVNLFQVYSGRKQNSENPTKKHNENRGEYEVT